MSKTTENKDVKQQNEQAPLDGGAGTTAAASGDQGLEKSDAALWEEMDHEDAAAADTDGQASAIDAAAADDDQPFPGEGDPVADSDDASATGEQAGGVKQPAVDDIWKQATPAQRAAFEAAQAEVKKGEQYKRSNDGRVAALQRQIDSLKRGQVAQTGATRGSAAGQQNAGGFLDTPDYKKFSKEYPEIAGPLSKVITDLQSQVTGQTKMLDAIGNERLQIALNEQESTLATEHADWEQLAGQESFGDWLATQPRHIREAALRNGENIVDAEEASDVIGRYKDHLRKTGQYQEPAQQQGNGQQNNGTQAGNGSGNGNQVLDPKRKRQLGSAASTKNKGPGVASGIAEDADPKVIWKQMDAEEERRARRHQA
jgi:hypothetical protein